MMMLIQALQGSFSIRPMREISRISNLRVVSSHLLKSRDWIDFVLDGHGVLRACVTPAIRTLQIRSVSKGSLALLQERWFNTPMNWSVSLGVNIPLPKYAKSFWFSDQEGSLLSSQPMYCLQEISYQANASANVTVSDKSHDALSATLFLLGNGHFWPLVRQAWRGYSETLDAGGAC